MADEPDVVFLLPASALKYNKSAKNTERAMSLLGQPRRLSDLGMSASPPTPNMGLRHS
jgi:hypothetical protein